MHILLVEPSYYTRYPPLGLLKLATYHRALGDTVELVRGCSLASEIPDKVYVTSLFTYSWKPVHEAVRYYKQLYPYAEVVLGGIYATLMPDHARDSGADRIHSGLFEAAEDVVPDYSLVPDWKATSIVFSHRGCVKKCPFCAVPLLEPQKKPIRSIHHVVKDGHKKVILWDNNTLGMTGWPDLFKELKDLNVTVDFNQGLDADFITENVAHKLSELRLTFVRMACDTPGDRKALARAIPALKRSGFRGRQMIVYALYNWEDSPDTFLDRVKDLLEWGVVAYPMRFEPLDSLQKNQHVGSTWTPRQLDMIAQARRVIGYGGAFPPYEGLRKKFCNAGSFEEAFSLWPPKSDKGN